MLRYSPVKSTRRRVARSLIRAAAGAIRGAATIAPIILIRPGAVLRAVLRAGTALEQTVSARMRSRRQDRGANTDSQAYAELLQESRSRRPLLSIHREPPFVIAVAH